MTESSDMDAWDPLTEDYNDKNSNSYDTGTGANLPSHQQPANYRKTQDDVFVLWVRPLSSRYTDESLKNIFSTYGEVTDVSIIHPKGGDRSPFGYVVYKTQAAANDAIRRFNDDDKFDFKVNYAKDEAVRKLMQNLELRKNNQSQNHRNYNQSNHAEKWPRPNRSAAQSSNICDSTTERHYDDHAMRNHRANQPIRDSSTRSSSPSNAPLSDRSIISFSFSQSLFPSEKKTKEPAAIAVNNINSKPINESPKMKQVVYSNLPQCSTCKKRTFMVCSCCDLHFCDQECSVNGWRLHTGAQCVQVAEVVRMDPTKTTNTPSLNNGFATIKPKSNDKDSLAKLNEEFASVAVDYLQAAKNHEDPSRSMSRCTRIVDNNYDDNVDGSGYATDGRATVKSESRSRRYENKETNDESPYLKGEASVCFDRRKHNDRPRGDGSGDAKKPYTNRNSAQSRIDRNRMPNSESFTPQASSSTIEEADMTPFLTNRQRLREGQSIKVIVLSSLSANEGRGYVRIADEDDTFQTFSKLLNDVKSFAPAREESRKVVVRRENSWRRALSVSQSPLRFKLIDDGIYYTCGAEDVREIPAVFAQVVPFAHYVVFSDIQADQVQSYANKNEIITIKPLKEENKAWIVKEISLQEDLKKAREEGRRKARERGEILSSDSVERSPPKKVNAAPIQPKAPVPSSVPQPPKKTNQSVLDAGVPITVLVPFVKDDRVFFVTKADDFLEVNLRLAKENINELRPLVDIEPGVLCIGIFCEVCCRAKILSKDPLRVVYIDYGNEEPAEPKNLKILPSGYESIPPLATRVKLHDGTVQEHNVAENGTILITPIRQESNVPNSWIVCVGDKSSQFKEILSRIQDAEPVPSTSPSAAPTTATTTPTVQTTPPRKEPIPPVVMDACVTFAVSKREYYCIKKAEIGMFESINGQMSGFDQKASRIEKGKIYAKEFEGIWCRAKVVDTDPLTIYFIDYGNTEKCAAEELFELTEKLQQNPPPLAFRVLLKNESQDLLDYGKFMNLLWDVETDSYTLLRDPSAKIIENNATDVTGVVSC